MLIALLLAAAPAAAPAAAQADGPITAALSAPDGQFTVGDSIQLTLALTHPAGYQVIQPTIPATWGDFAVVAQSPATTVANGDGSETTTTLIDARLFQPGAFTTPGLEVSVTDGQGGLQKVVAAPAAVDVASVLQAGDAELRDIKPQAVLPMPAAWPWAVAGLAAAAVVVAVIWRARRREKLAVDNRQAHEIALDGLSRVEGLRLPQQGHYKEHYTLVSDIVRVYIERRFGVPTLERTTGEIRPDLASTDMPAEVSALLIAFLQESDLVKFSKWTPDMGSAQQLLAHGRMIVEATRPEPPSSRGQRRSAGRQQPRVEVIA
jgi:hypothetical protein